MIMLLVKQSQKFKFCVPYRWKTNLELDLKLDVQKQCIPCFSIKLNSTAEQIRKISFLFEDKQIILFLCLRTSKVLSLGEFDELKSHIFLVHFSARFSSKKGKLICKNMKKLTNLLLAGKGKESRKSSRKMQKLWSKSAVQMERRN